MGVHQSENSTMAIAIAKTFDKKINKETIQDGFLKQSGLVECKNFQKIYPSITTLPTISMALNQRFVLHHMILFTKPHIVTFA